MSVTARQALPHDLDAEVAVIGAMLLSRDAIATALEWCTPEDFYRPAHAQTFAAIASLYRRGEGVDAVTVADELRRAGATLALDDPGLLVSLQINTPSTGAASQYARIVAERAHLRRLQAIGVELSSVESIEAATAAVERARSVTEAGRGAGPRLPSLPSPVCWSEFWCAEQAADEWLIEPLVARGRQTVVYAPTKQFKSHLAAGGTAAASTGRSVFGQPPQPPVRALYLDLEMTEADLRERLADFGYGPTDDLEALAYYQLPALPPLDTAAGGALLLAMAEDHRAEVVVIDTMARVISGGENDSDSYRNFYRHTGLPLKQAGIALLRIDHSGKDPALGQRGSSAKAEDVDIVYRLQVEDANHLVLRTTHSRVSWAPAEVRFERHLDPVVSYTICADSWPAGTGEVAAHLDRLDVPLDATATTAGRALTEAGFGRRKVLVLAALKYRRSRS